MKKLFKKTWFMLAVMTLVGLGLRLLAWRWHAMRPLGGDEREYLDLAIYIAQGKGYYDLLLMRPPLFPIGMAVFVWLFDGDLQLLRLVNVLISTATIPLIYAWSRVLVPQASRRSALMAAGLTALSYTLALNATELLTETITLAGLCLLFLLLVRALREHRWRWVMGAGIALAVVCLIRSVALPLLGLGALLLWFNFNDSRRKIHALAFVVSALLTIAPWTMRNAITYHGFILIDTTGQENLWLDNDPRGREAVKAELYALGDQRVERGTLASQRGIQAISHNPTWFANKAWREFQRFWALEHSDDMLARPAIWQTAQETWLRLIFGDGLWLLVLLAGTLGVFFIPIERNLRLVLLIWLAFTVFTGMLFHVELRYRLPLLPILLPCAGWILTRHNRVHQFARISMKHLAVLALVAGLLGLTLQSGNYWRIAPRLASKHWLLWRANAALHNQQWQKAHDQASQALERDPNSVLARVILAQVAMHTQQNADELLLAAIAALPAHPYPHLLRGDLLRSQGKIEQAKHEFSYEAASTEDLQHWARVQFSQTALTTTLTLGFNDLGFIEGFYLPEDGSRWFADRATVWLASPSNAQNLQLEVAAQRPANVAMPQLQVKINGVNAGEYAVANDWTTITVPLPPELDHSQPLVIELRATSHFIPHNQDRTNPDGRKLGLRVRKVEIVNGKR